MSFNVNNYAKKYYQNIKVSPTNKYPRLKAWEFLYEYIWQESKATWADLVSEDKIETTALHIGFYLANWGMFRGSSGLLRNSNLDLMKDLAKLLFKGHGAELFELSMEDFASGTPELKEHQRLMNSVLDSITSLSSEVSWTDTLKSKILMGVWGECPALDRYYLTACRELFPRRRYLTSAKGEGLTALTDVIQELNHQPSVKFKTARLSLPYPTARIVDMALFQYGFEIANNKNSIW